MITIPRKARIKSEFGIYHVIQRGNEKKSIFRNNCDRYKYIEVLIKAKEKYNFLVHGYCLMDNHIHILLDTNGNDMSKIMQSISVSYAIYFNKTYDRCGHLFQDRFRSEQVLNDEYLLEVSRYIHNNLVKAGIVSNLTEYIWTSFGKYIGKITKCNEFVETKLVLGLFATSKSQAISDYTSFMLRDDGESKYIEMINDFSEPKVNLENYIRNMTEAQKIMSIFLAENNIEAIDLDKHISIRNTLIKKIREKTFLALWQIGEIFGGLSTPVVSRICKKKQE